MSLTEWNKKKKMLFQPTDNTSVLAGFTRNEYILCVYIYMYIYCLFIPPVCMSARALWEITPGSEPPLSADHICKYKASYVQSRAGLPPTAPLSRALIVILAYIKIDERLNRAARNRPQSMDSDWQSIFDNHVSSLTCFLLFIFFDC